MLIWIEMKLNRRKINIELKKVYIKKYKRIKIHKSTKQTNHNDWLFVWHELFGMACLKKSMHITNLVWLLLSWSDSSSRDLTPPLLTNWLLPSPFFYYIDSEVDNSFIR